MSLTDEAVDAVYEEFGTAARLTRAGATATVLVRRVPGPDGDPLMPSWQSSPTRQAQLVYVGLRRSEVPADPSGGVLEVLAGPDAGFYDIGDCAAQAGGFIWRLPLNPQVRR